MVQRRIALRVRSSCSPRCESACRSAERCEMDVRLDAMRMHVRGRSGRCGYRSDPCCCATNRAEMRSANWRGPSDRADRGCRPVPNRAGKSGWMRYIPGRCHAWMNAALPDGQDCRTDPAIESSSKIVAATVARNRGARTRKNARRIAMGLRSGPCSRRDIRRFRVRARRGICPCHIEPWSSAPLLLFPCRTPKSVERALGPPSRSNRW